MKIAILADPLDNQNAGVHNYTKGMVNGLISHGHEHEILLIREKYDSKIPNTIRQIVIPTFPFLLFFSSFRLFVIIPFICWFNRVDAVIEPAHFGPFNLPSSIKRVTVIHDLTPLLFPEHHKFYGRTLQKLFLPTILKKADLILTVSEHSAKDIAALFPKTKSRVKVVYPGQDTFFEPVYSPDLRRKYGLDKPFFLSVGTIEPRKNLILLLKAYEKYCRDCQLTTLLVIVGEKGWKYSSFYEELSNHPFRANIRLIGFVSKAELRSLYTESVVLIYPSLYEGFGLPVLEAFACGTPVICSNSSSLPEVGKEHAHYFSPEDMNELAGKMLGFSNEIEITEVLRSQYMNHSALFSWKAFTLKLLKEL